MNRFSGDITPAFASDNRGMQPLTDEQERLQRLLEAIILKTPGGVAKSIGEGIQTGVDVVGSIGQLDKAEQLGRQARRTLPDIVSAVTQQPGAVASALGQGLEQDVLDKGLGAFVGVEDAVPVVGKAGKLMGGIGAAAMMSKMPKMSKAAQDILDASKPANDFYDSVLAEMEDGPLKDELLAEATQYRTRQNELAKFVNETTPAPARVKFNMGSDGSGPAQLLLTKSAKEKGKWQGTIVDEQGPFTHISRSEYGDVVKELSQSFPQIIDNLKNAEIIDLDALKPVNKANVQTLKGFEESITTKYPDVDEFSLYNVGDDIELDRIVVDEGSRNKGVGTNVMKELIDYADKNGKRLILTTNQADQQLGTTSSGRLKDFYKQFGFVENVGENKDFRIKSNMYRSPIVGDDAEERARQMQKASTY